MDVKDCTVEEKTVTKVIPKSECANEEREVCGPEVCPIVTLPEVCVKEAKMVRRPCIT